MAQHDDERQLGRWLGGLAAVAVLGTGVWWWLNRPDPEIAQLKSEVQQKMKNPEQVSDAEKEGFRQRMQGLSPEQREAFGKAMAPMFMAMMERRLDQFLAMSPEQQRRELDEKIDQMEAMRKKFAASGRPMGPGGGQGGPPPFAGGGKGDPGKAMLDKTTPELRAKFEAALGKFNDRRGERGLPPVGPGRG